MNKRMTQLYRAIASLDADIAASDQKTAMLRAAKARLVARQAKKEPAIRRPRTVAPADTKQA